jgi:thiamine-monophosphate kinase
VNPLARRRSASVAALGERELIARIQRWLGPASPPPPAGIGDDCAALPPSRRQQLLTVDPVIFNRHFDASMAPAAVGAKLLKRNLSDLAAMGARPTAAVISLALPAATSLAWLEAFYRGLARASLRYGAPIVGGDCAQTSTDLVATLTLLGEAAGRRTLTRQGARVGDWIFVTGRLGGSLAGRHLRFEPRLAEGAWLARHAWARAMLDLSDGLAKDLLHLLGPGMGARLQGDQLPVSPAARQLAARGGPSALERALNDGEDYELLVAVDGAVDPLRVAQRWARAHRLPFTCIGQFVECGPKKPRIHVSGHPHLSLFGYEHFR